MIKSIARFAQMALAFVGLQGSKAEAKLEVTGRSNMRTMVKSRKKAKTPKKIKAKKNRIQKASRRKNR